MQAQLLGGKMPCTAAGHMCNEVEACPGVPLAVRPAQSHPTPYCFPCSEYWLTRVPAGEALVSNSCHVAVVADTFWK